MAKKGSVLLIIVILLQLAIVYSAYARSSIETFDVKASENALVKKANNQLMLNKTWYDYKFELNPVKTLGSLQMQCVDSEEYERALNEVMFPLEVVGNYKIYFLDYKLKGDSSPLAINFLDDSVVVFGIYRKLPLDKLHQMAVHELGHQVDFQLMNPAKWEEYKKIRGITDERTFFNLEIGKYVDFSTETEL